MTLEEFERELHWPLDSYAKMRLLAAYTDALRDIERLQQELAQLRGGARS